MINGHETQWGIYNSHSYDVDIGDGLTLHVIEELFDDVYGYTKVFTNECKEVIIHEFCQPRSWKTGKFLKRIEIVGA